MRTRLYRGVVKRACDDRGCDNPWPCSKHNAITEQRDHVRAVMSSYALPDAERRKVTDTACDCGYIGVCACPEEEPNQWPGVRVEPKSMEEVFKWLEDGHAARLRKAFARKAWLLDMPLLNEHARRDFREALGNECSRVVFDEPTSVVPDECGSHLEGMWAKK